MRALTACRPCVRAPVAQIIQKPAQNKMGMLKAEVDILTKCDHPNIVKMYKCYETDKILYLVLELLTGGELFDTIIAKGHYSESDARTVTITLLKAIKYLHDQNVAHRDLKPENILLKDKGGGEIKITDFGNLPRLRTRSHLATHVRLSLTSSPPLAQA